MIRVSDDGCGMTPNEMKIALQFGGSNRFGSTKGTGRYGMGLPNSSVSQARRVEIYSWVNTGFIYRAYLDIDEIITGRYGVIAKPRRVSLINKMLSKTHGTVVEWTRCDRISYNEKDSLFKLLSFELGRIFRKFILQGKQIFINGKKILSVDPLFLTKGNNLHGAIMYGSPIKYKIKVPGQEGDNKTSTVEITFSELPIDKLHTLSNKAKRDYFISKNRGVSIIRANREIDTGWYFMGSKRKENYDDWWRCEISFNPDLDEMFGVTHTKQGVNPTADLQSIMTSDIESIAHRLNSRVRSKFLHIKNRTSKSSERRAERYGVYFSPPSCIEKESSKHGLKYTFSTGEPGTTSFFDLHFDNQQIEVVLNEQHPFYQSFYKHLGSKNNEDYKAIKTYFEILLLAAARAECQFENTNERKIIMKFRELWSDVLTAYTL